MSFKIKQYNNLGVAVHGTGSRSISVDNKEIVCKSDPISIKMLESGCGLVDILMQLKNEESWKIRFSISDSLVWIEVKGGDLFECSQKYKFITELPLYEIRNYSISKIDEIELRNNTNSFENIDWDTISASELRNKLKELLEIMTVFIRKRKLFNLCRMS